MKTIGLLGGVSWQSTVSYYKIINETVAQALGGLHSAQCLLHSVDFAEIETRQQSGRWDECATILTTAAQGLQAAGAQLMVICANTMHKVAPQVQAGISIPLVHIAAVTAGALLDAQIERVALLGTTYTMRQNFYKDELTTRGLSVLLPAEAEMDRLNAVIFDELCRGIISPASKAFLLSLVETLAAQGAQGVILGCTELGLLISQADTAVPLFDTAFLHARHAALLALE